MCKTREPEQTPERVTERWDESPGCQGREEPGRAEASAADRGQHKLQVTERVPHPSPCSYVICVGQTAESRRGCQEKFALGNSRESSDFPEGRSPKGKSDNSREFPWPNFPDNP